MLDLRQFAQEMEKTSKGVVMLDTSWLMPSAPEVRWISACAIILTSRLRVVAIGADSPRI